MLEARIAATDAEREAVFRHRYQVYVEELGRYWDRADHGRKRLADPEDDHSQLIYVADRTGVVASERVTWGGHAFSTRQIEAYALKSFLAELPAEVLGVGERTMVSASHRGGDLFATMAAKSNEATGFDQLLVAFGACEPHLIGFYSRWQRPYATRNINHPESGYLIPVVSFPKGVDTLAAYGDGGRLPSCVQRAIAGTGAVTCSQLTDPDEYQSVVTNALARVEATALSTLTTEQLASLLRGSNIITCAAGDRIVRAGGTAHTLFVVLDGAVSGDRSPAGRVVGHSTAIAVGRDDEDIIIAADGTRVLALSERTLSRLNDQDPSMTTALASTITRMSR